MMVMAETFFQKLANIKKPKPSPVIDIKDKNVIPLKKKAQKPVK
jgi:hypothetical protein